MIQNNDSLIEDLLSSIVQSSGQINAENADLIEDELIDS